MTINDAIKKRNITKYRLSKESDVPYATISDICSGKSQLEKCSAYTLYKISKVLNVSMESLIAPCFEKRCNFELYKSNICHRLKALGDIDFIVEVLERDDIRKYYQKEWYPECLYLLAMLDYVSNQNEVPLCNGYDDLRKYKLKETVYPASIRVCASVAKSKDVLSETVQEALSEFMRFNIVENEVRNVI